MSSNIKVSVRLTEASRFGSPVIFFVGKSGKQHQFIWNPQAERHLLGGKLIDAAEWNKLAEDLLDPRERNRHKVVAEIVGAEGAPAGESTEELKAKIAQLELAFNQSEEATVALQSDLLKASQRIAELEGIIAAPAAVAPDVNADLQAEVERLKADNLELTKLLSGNAAPADEPAKKATTAPRKTAAQKKAEAAAKETPPAAE